MDGWLKTNAAFQEKTKTYTNCKPWKWKCHGFREVCFGTPHHDRIKIHNEFYKLSEGA